MKKITLLLLFAFLGNFSNAQLTTVANNIGTPYDIEILGQNLYVSRYGLTNEISSINYLSSNPTVTNLYISGNNLTYQSYMETDGNNLYILNGNGQSLTYRISKINLTTNTSALLLTDIGSSGIAIHNNNLYYTNNSRDKILKINLTESNPTPVEVVISGVVNPRGFVISGNFLYVANNSNKISRIDLMASSPTTITDIVTGISNPFDLEISGDYLYIAQANDNKISKININQSLPATVETVVTGLNQPTGLAINGNELYISEFGGLKISKFILNNGSSCANATPLTANSGTVTMGTITGESPTNGCYTNSQANANANWWSFTPSQNGYLTVTSATAQNATSVNTILQIFKGTCNAYTCEIWNNNISTTDLRSKVENLEVQAGQTYFIVWDDYYTDNAATNFYYEFTPSDCFTPTQFQYTSTPTTSSVAINWQPSSLGNTAPQSYSVEIGPRDYVRGSSSTILSTTTTSPNYTFTGLSQGTAYDVYVKTNCSTTESSVWTNRIQVITAFEPVTPPYQENFESDISLRYLGIATTQNESANIWRLFSVSPNTSPFVASGYNAVLSASNATTNTNSYMYFKPLNLTGGTTYYINFKLYNYVPTGNTTSYEIEVLTGPNSSNPANFTSLWSETNAQSPFVYNNKQIAFTPTASGVYRIAIRNKSLSTGTGTHVLYIDDFSVTTSTLNNENFELNNQISIYPNPVQDILNVEIKDAEIANIEILSLEGKQIMTTTNKAINTSSLSKGMYLVKVYSIEGKVGVKKIIK